MPSRNQINPPPLRKITDFKSKLTGGGARANLFEVVLQFPDAAAPDSVVLEKSRFLVKGANMPASNVAPIEVPFRGRVLKIAGDRTFDTWSPTFFNDKDFKVRAVMEQWMEAINGHAGNTADLLTPSASSGYTRHLLVHQLEKGTDPTNSAILRTYKLWYAFPTNVSQIDLAYDSNDQIEEFSVEFQYSYWTTEDISSARAGLSNRQVNADV